MRKSKVTLSGAEPTPDVRRPRTRRVEKSHEQPEGVQGPNLGYWQADGATRAAIKRSKRP